MDESRLIDWYEVVEAVANGRLTGHACPMCGARPLETSKQGANVRVRCPRCGEGFEGALGYGRDDGLYAEADALMKRQAEAKKGAPAVEAPQTTAPPVPAPTTAPPPATSPAPPAAEPQRDEDWSWRLPASSGADYDGLATWMDLVEAVMNGRRSGLRCPFCSEPLDDVFYDDPHVRIHCRMCGEAFEGRVR